MTTTRIPQAFAQDGTRTPMQTTRTDGVVNLDQGYTDDYSRELGVDPSAKAVERDTMNWLLWLLSSNVKDWQEAGHPQWLSNVAYAPPAFVRYTGGTAPERLFRCTANSPAGTLPTDIRFWEEVPEFAAYRALVPMPYRAVVATATGFNTLVTNGTWVFDSAAVVAASADSPPGAGVGVLEVRLTGAGDNSLVQRYTDQAGGLYVRGRRADGTWVNWVTSTFPVPVSQGGTGATTAEQARTNLGLGTAAVQNIGTTGANVPLMSGINTWTGPQTFGSSSGVRAQGFGGAANYARYYGGTGAAFLEYDGTKWAVANPAGSGTYTIIDGGGTTWTSGNFSPASKLNVSGGTVTGPLAVNGTAVFGPEGANRVRTVTVDQLTLIQATNPGQTAVTPLVLEGDEVQLRSSGFISLKAGRTFVETNGVSIAYGNSPGPENPGGFAFRAVGQYGGGYSMVDGARTGAMYMAFGGINWGTSGGVITAGMTLNGSNVLSTTGGFNFGSSRKLKDIEGASPYGLNEVLRITTLIGKYKEDYNPDGVRRVFFDAENMLDVMPELVDAEGVKFNDEMVPAVRVEQTVVPLYKAIQDMHEIIMELRSEIASLKGGA